MRQTLVPKPNFSNIIGKKLWSKKLKASSMLIVTIYPLVLNFSVTSSKSEISLLDSLIHLLATHPAFLEEINNRSTFLSLAEKTFK